MSHVILLCVLFWSEFGVFGCVSVSVTEGDCVTFFVDLPETKMKKGISWKFGSYESVIADIKSGHITISDDKPDKRFKDKLQLNKHTGDLTITNTSITHTGLYQMTNIKTNEQLTTFTLTVYARLPVPVISRVSSLSGSSKCSVLCLAVNVSHVSLSWYKGKSLLSSIIVSEHSNINISLHLECLNDSYTCVINNPITNQTQHLNTDVCHKCSAPPTELSCCCFTEAVIRLVVSALVGVATVAVLVYDVRSRRDEQ
ncbi:SLAM family member 9-like [Triplophysa dalaica]|uniref:SLAM family member 9-like n=1 Tax=Triplophysa dalaica TaxID=1582913 RepID=UPI0024DF9B41|nr:SLAM family member 9-like [Triplophysa dalaica]